MWWRERKVYKIIFTKKKLNARIYSNSRSSLLHLWLISFHYEKIKSNSQEPQLALELPQPWNKRENVVQLTKKCGCLAYYFNNGKKNTSKKLFLLYDVIFCDVFKRTETALNYTTPIENLFCRTNAFTKTNFDWYLVSSVYNILFVPSIVLCCVLFIFFQYIEYFFKNLGFII